MQFAVPQFTDVEDKLIGSLTLRQFLLLLAVGGVILFIWSILGPSFIFFLISAPIALAGIAVALGRFNGRPAFIYLLPFVTYLTRDRVRIFKREQASVFVTKSEIQKKASPVANAEPVINESAESRLKKLAYLLDSKEKEEQEILVHDANKVITSPTQPQIDLSAFVKRAKKDAQSLIQPKAAAPKASARVKSSRMPAIPVAAPVATQKPAKQQVAHPPAPVHSAPKPVSQPPTPPKPKKFDPSSFLERK